MIYTTYQEFVIYSLLPDKVQSRNERLNTEDAFRVQENGQYSTNYTPDSSRGAVMPYEYFMYDGDEFEAMRIDDYGHVTIWTENKVWYLMREGNDLSVERMKYVDRNPFETPSK